jgi:hypothetical protein
MNLKSTNKKNQAKKLTNILSCITISKASVKIVGKTIGMDSKVIITNNKIHKIIYFLLEIHIKEISVGIGKGVMSSMDMGENNGVDITNTVGITDIVATTDIMDFKLTNILTLNHIVMAILLHHHHTILIFSITTGII